MKKAKIIILALLAVLLLFVSCDHSVDSKFKPQPTPTPTPTPDNDVWQVGEQKFEFLQDAVDYLKTTTATEITLIKDEETGPGAIINGSDFDEELLINFNGHSFTFSGTYGIKVINEAEVRVFNTTADTITLEESTDYNKLIEVVGVNSTVTIEGLTNLDVRASQYTIYSKDGASVTVGSEESSLVKLSGMIGCRNDNDTPTTTVILSGKTSATISGVNFMGIADDQAKLVLGTVYQQDGHTGRVYINGVSNYEFGSTVFEITSTVPQTIVLSQNCYNLSTPSWTAAIADGIAIVE